jgi:hypothetical protein
MADKPPSQFERRSQHAPAPSSRLPPPGKRSNHVALLVMGTLAVGGTAYALMPRECAPAAPGTTPGLSTAAECPPRGSSSSHGGSGSSRYGYSSAGSSGATPAATTDAGSGGVKRGGFGAFAHSFSSHFSFGG